MDTAMATVTDMAMVTAMAVITVIMAIMGKRNEWKENKLSVVIKKNLPDRSGYLFNYYFLFVTKYGTEGFSSASNM